MYCKSDVILLADVNEKFVKVSNEKYGINLLYCVSLPAYTYQCALKYTDNKLETLHDKDWILSKENIIRGGISSVMGDCYIKSNENKKILYMDATIFHGHSMTQIVPYDEIEMWHGHPDLHMIKPEEIINTPGDSDVGYFVEVDLIYPNNIKEKTKNFPFCPENKNIPDKNIDYKKKLKPKNYKKSQKLICDWTDKKKYLIH